MWSLAVTSSSGAVKYEDNVSHNMFQLKENPKDSSVFTLIQKMWSVY